MRIRLTAVRPHCRANRHKHGQRSINKIEQRTGYRVLRKTGTTWQNVMCLKSPSLFEKAKPEFKKNLNALKLSHPSDQVVRPAVGMKHGTAGDPRPRRARRLGAWIKRDVERSPQAARPASTPRHHHPSIWPLLLQEQTCLTEGGTSEKCQTRTCGWHSISLRGPPISFQSLCQKAGRPECVHRSLGQSSLDERFPRSFSQFN
jgi:hypothetical protein